MPFPFDLDVVSFVFSTFQVFASKGAQRKNAKSIPVRYERRLIDDASLTPEQKNYIAPIDAQLAALNYTPLCTYQVINFGANMVRQYFNPTDRASCTLTIVEIRVTVGNRVSVKNSHVVNFTTRFSTGQWLITRNMEHKDVLDTPDFRTIQECLHTTSLVQLKKIHDRRAATFGIPLSPPSSVEALFEESDVDNARTAEFRVQHGSYRLNAEGNAYLLTDKVFNRGIRNHFNPFAGRLSVPVAIFSILVSAVLPLFGILKLAPALEDIGRSSHLPISPERLAILSCYVLTGIILGFITESQNYVWITLITYIPAHFIADSYLGWAPYSAFAFLISYFVCQAKRKRQLILLSKPY